jgi:hypothetical protein
MLDFNCKYLVPMSKVTDPEDVESLVECSIKQGHKPFELVCVRGGYRSKGFYTDYFEYLVKTGYAKKIDRYVTYFEVTHSNTLAGYTCIKSTAYVEKMSELANEYPDLQLVYREWSDGTIEDGDIEKEDWGIG